MRDLLRVLGLRVQNFNAGAHYSWNIFNRGKEKSLKFGCHLIRLDLTSLWKSVSEHNRHTNLWSAHIYFLLRPKTFKLALTHSQKNKAVVFLGLTVHCFCVSQKPVCVTVSVMADNLIVFHTLLCQGFPFFSTPHFRTKASRGLQILSPNPWASDSRACCVVLNKWLSVHEWN